MSTLRISQTLALPLEAITETIAILGIRGSGKTNTCVVLTEELLDAGQQVVIIDPTDVWWGLKSSKDGTRAGYPVVIFGGRHGDVPLAAGDGATVADFIVEERVPAILSLRHFESQGDQRRFVTDFARRLYHRKGEEGRETPMLLAIDEAHLFIPQRVGAAEAQMVGAIQKLVRQGRASGIGVAVIDQRAASVNKDILTQLELLICHRTSSPQDRKALEAWIEQHDTADQKGTFLKRLAELGRGVAWCWSPGWLDIFKEVPIRERRTFDSSATPKAGEVRVTPTTLARIDLDALKVRMSAAIEKADADDPVKLRARIVDLTRQLAKQQPVARVERVEVDRVVRDDLLVGLLEQVSMSLIDSRNKLDAAIARAEAPPKPPKPSEGRPVQAAPAGDTNGTRAPSRSPTPSRSSTSTLGGGERKILTALAQRGKPLERSQIAVMTGYSSGGGRFSNLLSALRSAGLIMGEHSIELTEKGRVELGDYEPIPSGRDALSYWKGKLGGGEGKILDELASVYPRTLTRDALGNRTGYEPSGGRFSNLCSYLRTLELIRGTREMKLSEELVG